ncbi:Predicted PurR-regulated permease PerM [Amycolatopsis xylanica]|uniref:Predicted PurR-regulated permease PerM n=1 Tax=Amycolatopsis xylanica TaxID=589385 RepID=A0A1H2VYC1_9PSEU|nr:AI-2E family transporter [Amycolatopsis xylanica]SDW73303.1 Predicted PurR-regulated permease PerM [Amycolatopsis xylanica]
MTTAAPALPRCLVILLGTAAAVVTVAGLKAMAWLITPVLLALVIVIVLSPVHAWLRQHGFRPWAATLVLVLLIYGLLVAFSLVVIVSVAKLTSLLPQYTDRVRELATSAVDAAGSLGVRPGALREAANSLDLGKVLTSLGGLLGDLTGLTTSIVFLLALLLFFSVEANGIDSRLSDVDGDRPQVREALGGFAGRTRRYLAVATAFGLIVAVVDTVALLWLGIPLAVLWGLLSFVTNYIPNIGFLLGLLPPALLALLGSGWQRMVAVIVVYALINFVAQSVIQPRYVGDAVGLSTALTFVSLVFWAWVLGPVGVLLAIPATLLVMAVLVEIDPAAGWVAALVRAPPKRTDELSPG